MTLLCRVYVQNHSPLPLLSAHTMQLLLTAGVQAVLKLCIGRPNTKNIVSVLNDDWGKGFSGATPVTTACCVRSCRTHFSYVSFLQYYPCILAGMLCQTHHTTTQHPSCC